MCYDDSQMGFFFLACSSFQNSRAVCIQLPDGLSISMPHAYLKHNMSKMVPWTQPIKPRFAHLPQSSCSAIRNLQILLAAFLALTIYIQFFDKSYEA